MDNEELERRAKITIEQCDGIQPMHMILYSQSIHYSADRCLSAFKRYNQLLVANSEPTELISTVQEAIGHAAALSRYFWPTSMGNKNSKKLIEMRKSRGKKLRLHFGVTDDSPISNRDLRNAWEHFDEKLDTYLISNDAGLFIPKPVIGDYESSDNAVDKIFKLIDTNNECLVLLGNKFFFKPLREEVERIFEKWNIKNRL